MLNNFNDIAEALSVTTEELNERTLQAAGSDENDRCISPQEWESYPLLSMETREHLLVCGHCSAIKALLENELESESFAHAAARRP